VQVPFQVDDPDMQKDVQNMVDYQERNTELARQDGVIQDLKMYSTFLGWTVAAGVVAGGFLAGFATFGVIATIETAAWGGIANTGIEFGHQVIDNLQRFGAGGGLLAGFEQGGNWEFDGDRLGDAFAIGFFLAPVVAYIPGMNVVFGMVNGPVKHRYELQFLPDYLQNRFASESCCADGRRR
jgi:hypothetical protein